MKEVASKFRKLSNAIIIRMQERIHMIKNLPSFYGIYFVFHIFSYYSGRISVVFPNIIGSCILLGWKDRDRTGEDDLKYRKLQPFLGNH